jgi:DNA-binding IclR family transcriptional regulator
MKDKRTIQSVSGIMAAFFRDHRRMPSYQEMLDLLGVKSKSVVHFWVNKLVQQGIIERDETGHLRITKIAFGIPMGWFRTSWLPIT